MEKMVRVESSEKLPPREIISPLPSKYRLSPWPSAKMQFCKKTLAPNTFGRIELADPPASMLSRKVQEVTKTSISGPTSLFSTYNAPPPNPPGESWWLGEEVGLAIEQS